MRRLPLAIAATSQAASMTAASSATNRTVERAPRARGTGPSASTATQSTNTPRGSCSPAAVVVIDANPTVSARSGGASWTGTSITWHPGPSTRTVVSKGPAAIRSWSAGLAGCAQTAACTAVTCRPARGTATAPMPDVHRPERFQARSGRAAIVDRRRGAPSRRGRRAPRSARHERAHDGNAAHQQQQQDSADDDAHGEGWHASR